MNILGICHDVLICSACVVVDGNVVAAMAEERLDRVKQSRVFPQKAIEACLAMAKLSLSDIDEIAVAWNPAIEAETTPGGFLSGRRWRNEHFLQLPGHFLKNRTAAEWTSQENLWADAPPITYVNHHLAHLGNAVFLAPFSECAVCILDGRGERATGWLGRITDGTTIETLETIDFPHSIGLVYGAVTQFLGFTPDSDEWKVMALASFAETRNAEAKITDPSSAKANRDTAAIMESGTVSSDANADGSGSGGASGDADDANEFLEPMRQLIRVEKSGRYTVDLSCFEYFNFWHPRMFSDRFCAIFGPPRRRDEPLTPRHERIASALQTVFEERIAEILCALHARTGTDRLVVSGGCFMNSVVNGKLSAISPFRETFITSCPDDSGTSIGAALYLSALRTGKRPGLPVGHGMTHNFWGREFSDAECWETAQRYKLSAEIVDDPSTCAAADLAAGKIIGWFQGRAEFGQRALGHRSILLDPRRADGKDVVNAAVKYREHFRPFAPAILAEFVADYFECSPDLRVPFMERVLKFRPERMAEVPAVVHVDGTGRAQTVDASSSPRFHALIRAFHELTGVPIVLNTSFNLNGEPIVDSPTDAIRTFFSCGLDTLYLGTTRITKN